MLPDMTSSSSSPASHASLLLDRLTLDDLHRAVLALNTLWFAAAFVCFTGCPSWTVRLLLPNRKENQQAQRQLLGASVRFLGNLNLACAALCTMLLLRYESFPSAEQKGLLCSALSLMHLSQFLGNLPLAWRELCTGSAVPGLWPVLRGTMRSIFLTDAFMATIDAAVACCYFQPEMARAVWSVVKGSMLQPIVAAFV